MLLTIDAGNTNIVFAIYNGEVKICSWRMHTKAPRTADEYVALLSPLMVRHGIDESAIKDVLISSVVPAVNAPLMDLCDKAYGVKPVFITSDLIKDKININLDKPEDVGADRLVNAIAVCAHYQTPAVVVDFGTATTFDVIAAHNTYEGGVISPGINLSIEALHRAAAKLPMVAVEKPQRAIGKNTKEAMQSGIYWGYVGLIEGTLKRIEIEMGVKPYVIGTGGLAPLFSQGTTVIDIIDQDLTLKGLLEIYNGKK